MAIAGTHYYNPYSQPLPSPPMENNSRCTLPSISNLLDLADHGSPTTESAPAYSPRPEEWSSLPPRSNAPNTENRPESGYGKGPRGYPPSPPMSNETDQPSPLEKPMNHFAPKPTPSAYYHETTPPLETDRHHHQAQGYTRRPQPQPYQHHHSNVSTPTSTASSYFSASGASTPASTQPPHTPGLPHQRALPQAFPPLAVPVAVAPASGAISWQHHHYLQPAPGHFFPQSQDRYICPTCNKAFSRPSSLRIHSHSHTGEKPFKCSQAGCGKAFSVRSNMKRHERGCHSVQVPHGHMP